MATVDVNIIDLGPAADAGAVRYDFPQHGTAVIVVHEGLPVDERSELISGLLQPGETLGQVTALIPAQRHPQTKTATGLRVAGLAASAIVLAACAAPHTPA